MYILGISIPVYLWLIQITTQSKEIEIIYDAWLKRGGWMIR